MTDPDQEDADGDGVGDACDPCPSSPAGATQDDQNPAISNCNLEAELAEWSSDAVKMPVLRRADYPSDQAFAADTLRYRQTFLPNACDPRPCPKLSFVLGGTLPAVELPTPQDKPPQCGLEWWCDWSVVNNITYAGTSSLAIDRAQPVGGGTGLRFPSAGDPTKPGGVVGNVGFRWCWCSDSDTHSLAGRVGCRSSYSFRCSAAASEYSKPNSKWLKMVTQHDGDWNSTGSSHGPGKDLGAEPALLFAPVGTVPGYDTIAWDFLDLGAPYVQSIGSAKVVAGVLCLLADVGTEGGPVGLLHASPRDILATRKEPGMKRRSRPHVVLAVALAAATCRGCISESLPASSLGTAAAGGGGAHGSSSTTIATTGSATGGSDADATGSGGGGAGGFPTGDPGWQAVPWAQACATEVATHPGNAAPPLRWQSCANEFPGCERAVVDWENSGIPYGLPFVVKWNDGYRVGLDVGYPKGSHMGVLYDVDGSVLQSWRIKVAGCGSPAGPIPRQHQVWIGIQGGLAPSSYVVGTYASIVSAPGPLPLSTPSQDASATDDTLALQAVNGKTLVVYDRLADRHDTYQPHPGLAYDHPFAVADSVLVRYAPAFETFEARVWNRSTHAVETLVSALPDDILDVKGDGQTLVWLRAPHGSDAEGYYLQGDLWTSPFATSKNAVKPTKRRPAPLVGEIRSTAGEGHYALYSPKDERVHVYRLSDMRHWSFGTPPDAYALYDVAYVDARYVYYRKIGTMFRQALDALGPGDPPP